MLPLVVLTPYGVFQIVRDPPISRKIPFQPLAAKKLSYLGIMRTHPLKTLPLQSV